MATIDRRRFDRYARDPAAFRADLIVDVDGVARRFGDVMDDWQRADFAALDGGLKRCAGRSRTPATMRAYLERPRGHSKTTDLATIAVWSLAFATRPLRGYCYAADRDQARLLRDAIETIVRLNPWLESILSVDAHKVSNRADGHPGKGGSLTVESCDVGSSYGILPDLIIADELTHWTGDGSLWHSLLSSAAKRSGCLLVIISNAGFVESWQWAVREAARTDDDWYFSRLDGPIASWITSDRLAEQRRMLPTIAYARLWENLWSTGGGDALTPEDIDAAFVDDLVPMTARETGWLYVAGVDLGVKRDNAAVVTLAVPSGGTGGRIRLAANRLWKPVPGRKVDLLDIEGYLVGLDATFGLENIVFDPWQAELLAQRLESDTAHKRRNARRRFWKQPWCREVPPSGTNLRNQATLTLECFADRRLLLYPCEPLRRDLLKLRVEEKSYGYRLTSPRDGDGHGDTFAAFALALLVAHELAGRRQFRVGSLLDSGDGATPFARAIRAFGLEADAHDRDQMAEHARYDPHEPLRNFMRLVGRSR